MDKIKKNIKRIWNSKCKYLVMIACALILMNGFNLLQAGLKFLNEKEEVNTKLVGDKEIHKESEEAPKIRAGYYVDYNLNLPSGCTSKRKDVPTKPSYFAYEIADIPSEKIHVKAGNLKVGRCQ